MHQHRIVAVISAGKLVSPDSLKIVHRAPEEVVLHSEGILAKAVMRLRRLEPST